ncbi:MAG: DUF3592 domain-containing protein [Planctomycetota bacterium]
MRYDQRADADGCLLPFLTVFGVVWLGVLAAFDTTLIRQKLAHLDARARFEPTPATIVESRVDTDTSGDGTSYLPSIRFRYEFGGAEFIGERHSFSDWVLPSRRIAEEAVERYPEGAERTAYVDPREPSLAILDIEGTSFPTVAVLLLTPFHCVGLFVLITVVRIVRRRRDGAGDATYRRFVAVDRDDHFVLHRPRAAWWQVFLVVLGVLAAAAGAFLVVRHGLSRANELAVLTLGACVAAAVLLVLAKSTRDRRPSNFLHVDRARRTFSHPAEEDLHPIDAVTAVGVTSKRTNVEVNGAPMLDHRIEAELDGRRVPAFSFRGPEGEGEAVRALIAEEFDALR